MCFSICFVRSRMPYLLLILLSACCNNRHHLSWGGNFAGSNDVVQGACDDVKNGRNQSEAKSPLEYRYIRPVGRSHCQRLFMFSEDGVTVQQGYMTACGLVSTQTVDQGLENIVVCNPPGAPMIAFNVTSHDFTTHPLIALALPSKPPAV
jgi:hypothetical protein